jgi:uncharacterized membrane protein YhaH (DUF805 family)
MQMQTVDRFSPRNSLEIQAYSEPQQQSSGFDSRGIRWHLLYLSGRLNRTGFIGGHLAVWALAWIMNQIPQFFIALPLQMLVVWAIFALNVKRLHDFNLSGYWACIPFCMVVLIIAAPFFGTIGFVAFAYGSYLLGGLLLPAYLVLALLPGTKGTNRFC